MMMQYIMRLEKRLLLYVGYLCGSENYSAEDHVHETAVKGVPRRLRTSFTTKSHSSGSLPGKAFNNFFGESFKGHPYRLYAFVSRYHTHLDIRIFYLAILKVAKSIHS